jgi:hypothetical protein
MRWGVTDRSFEDSRKRAAAQLLEGVDEEAPEVRRLRPTRT